MKNILIIPALFFLLLCGCIEAKEAERFVSIQTKNLSTQLLLDSKLGHVWQISRTEGGKTAKIPINKESFGGMFSSAGRFRLKPTPNIWNYTLIDTKNGTMWRVQFSLNDPKMRYIEPVK